MPATEELAMTAADRTVVGDALAALLRYPGPEFKVVAEECCREIARRSPSAASELQGFREASASLSTEELEELYTRTFDLNPVCSLEVGWHLYGEQYERGAFLARLRELLAHLGVEEGTELPDHLMLLLPAWGRMAEDEAASFGADYLAPALAKMLAGLSGKANPYERVLAAAAGLLPAPQPQQPKAR